MIIDEDISNAFNATMKEIEAEQEAYWNSLSKEDQLKAFCAVTRRIYKGDIEMQGTYRYVLYEIFGFGQEAYVQGMESGYMSIHNAIFTAPTSEISSSDVDVWD